MIVPHIQSVQPLSRVRLFATPWTAAHQGYPVHHQPLELAQTHVSRQWCHPTIPSSVIPFSSCFQSFPASGSFPMSQFFASGNQSLAIASDLPMNIQDWFPLGLTGLISLQSKGFSRVLSKTTVQMVQKHPFFGAQLSLWCNLITQLLDYTYMTTGKAIALTRWTFVSKEMSLLSCCRGWS